MPQVYLSLGSNMGDKEHSITQALKLLSERCTVKKISRFYRTEPVSTIPQEWFLNCAVEGETSLHPAELLSFIQSIEQRLGRVKITKDGPRIIDIDILFYENKIIRTKNLVVPHPLLQDRLFVLQPMMDLNPALMHPVLKKTIQTLYQNVPKNKKVLLYK
jgi:2-amino-4-hydroxy-6-hydroxymethyldihydropteridine diphosphokinase